MDPVLDAEVETAERLRKVMLKQVELMLGYDTRIAEEAAGWVHRWAPEVCTRMMWLRKQRGT